VIQLLRAFYFCRWKKRGRGLVLCAVGEGREPRCWGCEILCSTAGDVRHTCDRPLSVMSHCAGQHHARPAKTRPHFVRPLRGLFLLRFRTHGLRRGLRSGAASRLMCPSGAAVDAWVTIRILTLSAKSADKRGATRREMFRVVLSSNLRHRGLLAIEVWPAVPPARNIVVALSRQ